MKKRSILILLLVGAFFLSACGSSSADATPTVDVNALYTAAAETMVAGMTQTAQALPPTPVPPTETPLPPDTPTPGPTPTLFVESSPTPILCDNYSFDAATVDVNVPDGSEMSPGQDFLKTWRIKNTGSCAWGEGYKLIYAGYANRMSGQAVPLPGVVAPGEEVEVSVRFKAPQAAGEYVSAWQMANAKGVPFGKPLYVKIVVR